MDPLVDNELYDDPCSSKRLKIIVNRKYVKSFPLHIQCLLER